MHNVQRLAKRPLIALIAAALALLPILAGVEIGIYLGTSKYASRVAAVGASQPVLSDIAYGGTIEGLGDSLWYGYYATNANESFRALIERHYGARNVDPKGPLTSASPGHGPGANSVAAALAAGTLSVQPASLLVVQLGDNDFGLGHTLSQFTTDYGNMIRLARREVGPATPMICLGVWSIAGFKNSAGVTSNQYDAVIQRLCAAQNGAFLSLQPYAYDVNTPGTPTYLGPADGFHPSTVGHARIAAAILCLLASDCVA
jgi:lysophospholipase L1-like esterase